MLNCIYLKDFYIIDAKPDNFKHLTGVNSLLSPQKFFENAYNGTLQTTDFNFLKNGCDEKTIKGIVRKKLLALPYMMNLFQNDLLVEESFENNQLICSFATTDNNCTLGFIEVAKARPKSLIRGNKLNANKQRE